MNLIRALSSLELPLKWTEWVQNDPGTPDRLRQFGSPTVLIDHEDIDGLGGAAGASSCRLYRADGGELQGFPSEQLVRAALEQSRDRLRQSSAAWKERVVAVPGIGIALLPNLACPACWPAYAAVISSLGLGFLLSSTYLLGLTSALLALLLAGFTYGAIRRRNYIPLVAAALGAAAVVIGKFVYEEKAIWYAGSAILVLSSLWNARPARRATPGPCPACVPETTTKEISL